MRRGAHGPGAGRQQAAAPGERARRKVWAAEAERARSERVAGAARRAADGGRGAEAGREDGPEGAATGRGRRCLRPLPPPARRPGSRSSGASGGRGPVPGEGGPPRPEPRRLARTERAGSRVVWEGRYRGSEPPAGPLKRARFWAENYWSWGGGAQRSWEKMLGLDPRELGVLEFGPERWGDSGILLLE